MAFGDLGHDARARHRARCNGVATGAWDDLLLAKGLRVEAADTNGLSDQPVQQRGAA